jgi:hypothetical protein
MDAIISKRESLRSSKRTRILLLAVFSVFVIIASIGFYSEARPSISKEAQGDLRTLRRLLPSHLSKLRTGGTPIAEIEGDVRQSQATFDHLQLVAPTLAENFKEVRFILQVCTTILTIESWSGTHMDGTMELSPTLELPPDQYGLDRHYLSYTEYVTFLDSKLDAQLKSYMDKSSPYGD